MSKISKLVKTPKLFMLDALKNFISKYEKSDVLVGDKNTNLDVDSEELTPTFVFGFSPWKQFLCSWFPERKFFFLPKNITAVEFSKIWEKKINLLTNAEIFIWGFKVQPYVLKFATDNGLKTYFVEDGFIRSIGLGATKTPPFSLTLDSHAPYFDSRGPTDLEIILSNYDFESDPGLIERAEHLMHRLISTGLSKYNQAKKVNINDLYGPKTQKRVLVIGQVEDDASIKFGCIKGYTNNDLVYIASIENPNAQIIYKPHPDVLNGHRNAVTNPEHVRHLCQVIDLDFPISQAFETVDHVYTITSQAGFEARMRNIEVTTLGCPFYSGWGLTDDRQPNPRRSRKLTVAQVFAASYILYPKYFDPIYKHPLTPEQAVDQLARLLQFNERYQEISPASVQLDEGNDSSIQDTALKKMAEIESELKIISNKVDVLFSLHIENKIKAPTI
jgi:capsular polysaccharide export protein